MTTITINENKYGFTIQRKNKKPVKFEAKNCKCILPINKNDSMWFIKIQLPNDVAEKIIDIEKQTNHIISNYELLSSLNNDMYINIKIPFRYRKFECDFYNFNDNQRITSNDINTDDELTIEMECTNIWKNEKYFSLTWKTKLIKKM